MQIKLIIQALIVISFVLPVAHAQRAKTVGDLLNNIKQNNKGRNIKIGNKSKTNLPQSADVFRRRRRSKVDFSKIEPPPSDTFLQGVNEDRAALEKITDKEIAQLYKLTQDFKSSPNRGELWLRLAESYSEKASLVEYRLNRQYENQLMAFEKKQISQRPRLNLKSAYSFNKRAIQLYEWFVRDYPRDQKMDQALFFLGFNYVEVGEVKKGVGYYKRLTQQYPRSPFVSEANFALAEYYFENDRWSNAYKHYMEVVKNKNARLNTFAQYKSAWCLYRMGQFREAFQRMVRLIKEGRRRNQEQQVAGMKQINSFKLEQEALRDFVVFYAEAGDPKRANAYFGDLAGRPKHIKHVEKLGYYYSDKGRREDARKVFNDLVSENPTAPKAFEYKYQVVLNYAYDKKTRIFREELYSWIKQFGPNSAWARANAGDKELMANATKLRELTLRNYVIQQHQTAQNSRAQYSQKLALRGYRLYLQEFPASEQVQDMKFYYGELLYDVKQYDAAAAEYLAVARAKKSQFAKQAQINAVLAIEKTLPSEQKLIKAIGKSVAPKPLPKSATRFIQVAEWFRKENLKHPKRTEITFRIARLYYLHNQFDKAEPYFFEIVNTDPKGKYGEFSANLILDGYNLRKDYKGLDVAARKLLKNPTIASSKLGRNIKEILENSNFQIAQNAEKGKDYKASAKSYVDFIKKNPKSKLVTKARFNAGVNYERAGDIPNAILFYEGVLRSRVGKSEVGMKKESRVLLARLYEKTGRYEEAAKQFELAAVENKAKATSFYYNAAVIYAGLGSRAKAISNYEKYFRSTKVKERNEAHFEIAMINLKAGKLRVAKSSFQDYINSRAGQRDRIVEAQFRIAEIENSLGQKGQALKSYQKVIGLQKRLGAKTEDSLQSASVASLELVRERVKKFAAIKIPASPKQQQKVVAQKLGMLKGFNAELAGIIKMNSPVSIVGSLVLLGQANHHMYDAFRAVPVPKGLNKEELAQYNAQVTQLIAPYKKAALDSYQAAVKKSRELHSYPEYLRFAFSGANKLSPESAAPLSPAFGVQKLDWMGI